ncbi:striated muscle preferentially expressed protein kinase-like protein [Aphelenchoides avenae]|nr:striated muscle preferentially expressed protein kinase-like protein [Aphelenchus avenae]
MARVVLLRDSPEPEFSSAIPGSHLTRKSFCSFQHGTPRPRAVIEERNLGLVPSVVGSRFLTARPKKNVVPEFTQKLEDQTRHHGDSIMMKVAFRGNPKPVLTWYVRDPLYPLIYRLSSRFKEHEPLLPTMRIQIYTDERSSEVAIFNSDKSDAGFYTCRIENDLAMRETKCHVYIGETAVTTPRGTISGANYRSYRSALYTPTSYYSRF